MARGRPKTPQVDIEQQQELYLSLLRLGLPETKITEVDGMPSWDTRWRWLEDEEFSARRLKAQSQGVELALVSHEEKLVKVYEMALDDAANKPLVDTLKEMGQHTRWKASKLASKTYGDKSQVEVAGKDGGKIQQDVTIRWADE